MRDAPENSPERAAERGGFRRGLLEPSLLSVGTAALVCASLVASMAVFVDESFAASPGFQYFAPRRGAHVIRVTSRILRLEQEQPAAPQVLVLGSSAVRNSVDTGRLEEHLRRAVGGDVEVLGLCTAAQPLALTRGMLDRVPRATRGVVVLGVGLRQLGGEIELTADLGPRPRLGLRSDVLDEAIRDAGGEPPGRAGVYAWDNRNFLGPRLFEGLLPNLFSGPREPVDMPHAGKPAHPTKHYDHMLGAVAEHLRAYYENAPRNAAELERLVEDVARRPTLELVLVESPVNPEFVARFSLDDEIADYTGRVAEIADRHGVPFLRLNAGAALVPGDFRDAVHLRKREASQRYTDLIADEVARRLDGDDE